MSITRAILHTIHTRVPSFHPQKEDNFSKKAINMFAESLGAPDSPGAHTQMGQDQPETVSGEHHLLLLASLCCIALHCSSRQLPTVLNVSHSFIHCCICYTCLVCNSTSSALTHSLHLLPPAQFLYDTVFDKEDPNFRGASKTHRDTQNPTMQTKDRFLGDSITTNALTYGPPTDFQKPDYARKPLIRDTFYRGVFVPDCFHVLVVWLLTIGGKCV